VSENFKRVAVTSITGDGSVGYHVFGQVTDIKIAEGVFMLFVVHDEFPVLGVPVNRLVRFRSLKDTEEDTDE
jgi:hypothetical protein